MKKLKKVLNERIFIFILDFILAIIFFYRNNFILIIKIHNNILWLFHKNYL